GLRAGGEPGRGDLPHRGTGHRDGRCGAGPGGYGRTVARARGAGERGLLGEPGPAAARPAQLSPEQARADRSRSAAGQRTCGTSERNRRSRRLLVTTNTEENAIAAPASIGLSSPAAATGMAATL